MKSLAVIVGRFQVPELDESHIDRLVEIIEKSDQTFIIIGVAFTPASREDPLNFGMRSMMIGKALKTRGIEPPKFLVKYLKDEHSDEAWSRRLDRSIGSDPMTRVTIHGSKKNFIDRYTGVHNTKNMEPIDIKNSNFLKERVNKYFVPDDHRLAQRMGAFHVATNMFSNPIPCVDIVVVDRKNERVLLGRKPNQEKWRFFGGFAENEVGSRYEDHALRELEEEANLSEENVTAPRYVTSITVNDWRYKHCETNIMTVLYEVDYIDGYPQAKDDIEMVRWFSFNDLKENYKDIMVAGHSEMYSFLNI